MRLLKWIIFIPFCMICLPGYVSAETDEVGSGKVILLSTGVLVGGELIFAANSGLATLSPKVYGGLVLLTSPLVLAEGLEHLDNTPAAIAATTMYAGLGLYNILVPDKHDDTDSEIFKQNMIAWNAMLLGTLAIYLVTGGPHTKDEGQKTKTQSAFSLNIALIENTPGLIAQYRF